MEQRRRFPRIKCFLPVRLYPHGQFKAFETLVTDLGEGGIRVVSPIAHPVATDLSLEISFGFPEQPLQVIGSVAWFQPAPKGQQYELGISFKSIPSPAARRLSSYLDRLTCQPSPAVS